MISRLAVILFLTFSAAAIVSAQSPPKQLTKEEEQKKQEELRKKIKETLDGAVSEVALLRNLENKTFFQVRIACLLWNFDEKGARSLLDDAQGLTASMINDPKISIRRSDMERETWERRVRLRDELISTIAERDPLAALEFLRQTKFVIPQDSMQSDRARDVLRSEVRLEQKLAMQVAKNDPKRALEIAEESLKKGFSPELNELVRVVFEKDKEAGKKLAGAILSKLKSTDPTDSLEGVGLALSILEGEYTSRRSESSVGGNMPGDKKRQPVLDDQTFREWNNFLIQTVILIGKDIQPGGDGSLPFVHFLSILVRLLPEIEKFNPTLAANFKQWHSQQRFDQQAPEIRIMGPMMLIPGPGNAKAEDVLAKALKSQGGMRREYIKWAVDEALHSEGNFELARKITEEHITDPDERNDKLERIEEKAKQYSLEHGKIEDAVALLMSLESDSKRAGSLADLAGRALKSGEKKLAAELLEKALKFLLQPVETRDEYEAMIRIIHNSIGIDRERSFEMFGSLIDPINQLVTATIQLNRFEGKRSDLLRDEMPLYYLRSDFPSHEQSRGDFPAKGFVEVIVPLSKADFDRTIGLADRIRQPELKLHMKLLAVQATTSE